MNRQITALAAVLLGACAAPGPATEPGTPKAAEVVEPPAAEVADAPTPAPESTASTAASDGVIEALPAAEPSEADSYPVAATPAPQPVVCRMERRTGSNRKIKVCHRQRSALDEADTRQTFDSLRRSQMGEPR